jgi:hypothetical protein
LNFRFRRDLIVRARIGEDHPKHHPEEKFGKAAGECPVSGSLPAPRKARLGRFP